MKTIINYLDDLKEKYGSDYKTAKALKVTKMSVSLVRKRGQCSDETALKMADLLNEPREDLLIAAAIARSNDTVKKAWEKLSQKAGLATGIFWTLGGSCPALIHAATVKFEAVSCILCKITKRKFFAIFKSFDRRKIERFLLNAHEGRHITERRRHDV